MAVVLKALASRVSVALVFLVIGGIAGAVAMFSRGCSPPPPSVRGAMEESTRTEPAKGTEDWKEEKTAPPPQIVVQRPKAGDRKRIAEEIDRPDLDRELTPEVIEAERELGLISAEEAEAALAAYAAAQERLRHENRNLKEKLIQFERELVARREIPPSPWGGTATATVSRITGRFDLDYQRKGRPRLNWLWDVGVGVRYQWQNESISGLTSDSSGSQMEGRAYVFAEPLEIGKKYPTLIRIDAGYEIETVGDLRLSGPFVGVTAEVRFNRDRRINPRTATEKE